MGSPTSLQPCRNRASQPLRGDPREADWGAHAQGKPHCPLITSAGVGEPPASGKPAGRRAAVWLLHSQPWRVPRLASRDPFVKASGQTTVAVRTPRMGAERGPSPLQSWPLSVGERTSRVLLVCFFLSPSTPKGRCVCSRHKCSPGEKQVHSQASGPLFGGGGPAFPPPTPTLHSELAARSLEPKAQPPLDSFLTVPSTPPPPIPFPSPPSSAGRQEWAGRPSGHQGSCECV